jgi:hypothetical protein
MNDDKNMKDWALANGSGSLRQAIEWDMAWRDMARHERLAMEVASSALLVPATRLNVGQFKAEGDCKVTTELGWYARTLLSRWADSKTFSNFRFKIEVVYFTITKSDQPEEGADLLVEGLTLPWFPSGHKLLIPLAYFNPKLQVWERHENPL